MDFTKLMQWVIDLAKAIFTTVLEFLQYVFLVVADAVLSAIALLIQAIPVPSFMTTNSMGSLLSGLPPYALFVISHLHVVEAFAIIGAGVLFNLTRKALTLGQW